MRFRTPAPIILAIALVMWAAMLAIGYTGASLLTGGLEGDYNPNPPTVWIDHDNYEPIDVTPPQTLNVRGGTYSDCLDMGGTPNSDPKGNFVCTDVDY